MLNVSDILLTMFLLHTGAFIEGNVFMRGVVQSREASFFIKLGIPLILLYAIYCRLKAATKEQLAIGNRLINGCLIFYTLINASHLLWIILYSTYSI